MTALVNLSLALWGLLSCVYPADLRRDYSADMRDVFERDLRDALTGRGFRGVADVWRCALREAFPIAVSGLRVPRMVAVPLLLFSVFGVLLAAETAVYVLYVPGPKIAPASLLRLAAGAAAALAFAAFMVVRSSRSGPEPLSLGREH